MAGFNMNLMGLLIAHSVAGKKLAGEQRSKVLLTSAIVPATGIAGILTPMALAQKEVADKQRADAQAEVGKARLGRNAGNLTLEILAKAMQELLKRDPQARKLFAELAGLMNGSEAFTALFKGGVLKPVLVDGIEIGPAQALATPDQATERFFNLLFARMASALETGNGPLAQRPPSEAPKAE